MQVESPENYAEWEQPVPNGYILHDSICVPFLKRQTYSNGDEISGC